MQNENGEDDDAFARTHGYTVKWVYGVWEIETIEGTVLISRLPIEMVQRRAKRDFIPGWVILYKQYCELSLYTGPMVAPTGITPCVLCWAAGACKIDCLVDDQSMGCCKCCSMWHHSCAQWALHQHCATMTPLFRCSHCNLDLSAAGGASSSGATASASCSGHRHKRQKRSTNKPRKTRSRTTGRRHACW